MRRASIFDGIVWGGREKERRQSMFLTASGIGREKKKEQSPYSSPPRKDHRLCLLIRGKGEERRERVGNPT